MGNMYTYESDELYHYGVLGMKWGIHRAKKKGVEYSYKSHGQKKYEKKLAKLDKKGVSKETSNYAKASKKLDMYKARDNNRVDYAKRTSVGKSIAKQLIFGPFGAGNYNRMRSGGYGRIKSALIGSVITTMLPLPVSVLLSKELENSGAKKSL